MRNIGPAQNTYRVANVKKIDDDRRATRRAWRIAESISWETNKIIEIGV